MNSRQPDRGFIDIRGGRSPYSSDFDGLVILSPFAWNGPWQTLHYVAREFARRVPVIFVDKPATWSPDDADFVLARAWRSTRPSATCRSVRVISTIAAPMARFTCSRRWSTHRVGTRVRHRAEGLGVRRPLGWVSYFAGCADYLAAIGVEQYIYHCLDAFESPEEARVASNAAAVFAVSRPLVERHRAVNSRTFHLPNGIEERALAAGVPKAAGPHESPFGRRIGYVGILTRHIDFLLLEKIAHAFPGDQLFLAGPVARGASAPAGPQKAALSRLHNLRNVECIGFVEASSVPCLVQSFSVGIIPFLSNAFNTGRDPIKFYHYLAQGKPIVTVPLAVAAEYSPLCEVAETHADFLHALGHALNSSDNLTSSQRISAARRHTWEAIVPAAVGMLERAGVTLRPREGAGKWNVR